jgi:hypothetical protein
MVEVVTDGKPFEAEFARALRHFDLLTPAYITEQIANGNMQCFLIGGIVFVTQVEEFPNGKALRLILAAGSNAKQCVPDAERFFMEMAKLNGCRTLLTTGRQGWAKYAKRLGWQVFNEYRKELK